LLYTVRSRKQMCFEMLLKSVQTRCTANVRRKCVPGTWTSDWQCLIAHPCPRPRDIKGEAVGRAKMWPTRCSWRQCGQIADVVGRIHSRVLSVLWIHLTNCFDWFQWRPLGLPANTGNHDCSIETSNGQKLSEICRWLSLYCHHYHHIKTYSALITITWPSAHYNSQ